MRSSLLLLLALVSLSIALPRASTAHGGSALAERSDWDIQLEALLEHEERSLKRALKADEDEDGGELADADPGDTDAEALKAKVVGKKEKKDKEDKEDKEEKKKKKKRPAKAPVVNKVVAFAPEANITNGDDVSDSGERSSLGVHMSLAKPSMRPSMDAWWEADMHD